MQKLQRLIIYALIFLTLISILFIWHLTPGEHATSKLLETEITFPELTQTPLSEAISIAESKIRQSHPRLKLFRIIYIGDTDQTEFANQERRSGQPVKTMRSFAASHSISSGITLPALTCPASEWLRYISELSPCFIHYDAGWVQLININDVPGNDPTYGWFKSYISPGRPE